MDLPRAALMSYGRLILVRHNPALSTDCLHSAAVMGRAWADGAHARAAA